MQRMGAARTKAPGAHGTVLVIGDSTSPKGQQQIAAQTPGATTVEAVDLRDLTGFGRSFDPGKAGSLMPAFAQAHGGPLNNEQINSLVNYLSTDFHYTNAVPIAVPVPARAGS